MTVSFHFTRIIIIATNEQCTVDFIIIIRIFWSTEHSLQQSLVNNLECNHTVGDISTDNESPFYFSPFWLKNLLRFWVCKLCIEIDHNDRQQFNEYEWIDLLRKFCVISFGRTQLFFFFFLSLLRVKTFTLYETWIAYCIWCMVV